MKQDSIPKFDATALVKNINNKSYQSQSPVISFAKEKCVIIQSTTFVYGIPLYSIQINDNFKFESCSIGVRCFIPSLTRNSISMMDKFSVIEEAINYLSKAEENHKSKVLSDYRNSMSSALVVQHQVYSPASLVRAFEYFCRSRSAFEAFRQAHQLPSMKTLSRITSKLENTTTLDFLKSVLDTLDPKQTKVGNNDR